jgi:hypothetical protein
MTTIAQLYTDRKHKNSKEVIPHFDILKISQVFHIIIVTNVSTDDLFDGIFQQKILVVYKMIFKTKIKLEN